MDTSMLMVYAGKHLERFGRVSNINLQKFIRIQDEIKKTIAIEEIDFALSLLVDAGFLEVHESNGAQVVYKRFIPKSRKTL